MVRPALRSRVLLAREDKPIPRQAPMAERFPRRTHPDSARPGQIRDLTLPSPSRPSGGEHRQTVAHGVSRAFPPSPDPASDGATDGIPTRPLCGFAALRLFPSVPFPHRQQKQSRQAAKPPSLEGEIPRRAWDRHVASCKASEASPTPNGTDGRIPHARFAQDAKTPRQEEEGIRSFPPLRLCLN